MSRPVQRPARALAALASAALLAALAVALPARAGAADRLDFGTAEPSYMTSDGALRERLFNETKRFAARIVRFNAFWFQIAPKEPTDPRDPADPTYDFQTLDAAVKAARARGLEPVLTLQRAPEWAEGPDDPGGLPTGVWKPDPTAFADYAYAVARRYDGSFPDPGGGILPRVRYLQLWNEGNLFRFLAPQYEGGVATSAERYRDLLNAAYPEVKSVHADNKVLIAGTAPLHSTSNRVGPETWLKDLFCLNDRLRPKQSCAAPARFDVFDHHAITPRSPRNRGPGDGARLADYHELTAILRAAEKHGTIEPAGRTRPLWTTEVYWETNPPDPATGVAPKRAAKWLQQGLKLLYEQDLDVVLYFFLRDLPLVEPGQLGNVQGGLLFNDLRPKPTYTAYTFPLVAERLNRKKVELFSRAPKAGRLKVQVEVVERRKGKKRKRWQTIRKKRVAAGDVFVKKAKLRKARGRRAKPYKLRARLPGARSLIYKVR